MFAFVIDARGSALDGSEIHIRATDEADAERQASARAKLFRTPIRRATDRDVRVPVSVAS